jgi:hypothetical protein
MSSQSPSVRRKSAASDSQSTLLVEWTEGAEKRGHLVPDVLVDGRVVGQVDQPLSISPGRHRIQVARRRYSTPALPCDVPAGATIVLECEFGELSLAHQATFLAISAAVWFSLQWIAHLVAPLADRDALRTVFAITTFGVLFAADWLLGPCFARGVLSIADRESPDAAEGTASDRDRAAGAARLPAGRLLVHLVVAPVRFIITLPPPRPKVFVDGRPLGKVAEPIRLRTGQRTVYIRGWFEHSDPISINVREGRLVELEAKRTSSGIAAVVATALPFAAAILSITFFNLIDQAILIMLGGAAASLLGMLVFSHWRPTYELEYRSD